MSDSGVIGTPLADTKIPFCDEGIPVTGTNINGCCCNCGVTGVSGFLPCGSSICSVLIKFIPEFMQALNPHGITAKLHKASGKSNAKKGQMKLIAENTSHHGVYTSVLKLPWSRRTRTPKNDPTLAVRYTIG
jgi:hypothetical protein